MVPGTISLLLYLGWELREFKSKLNAYFVMPQLLYHHMVGDMWHAWATGSGSAEHRRCN